MRLKHSLVVPCYNEEGNVKSFLEQAKSAMKGYTEDYEIVFVNDGSKDKTYAELTDLWNKNRDIRIKVVTFSRNFGKEAAILAGISNAIGEYITIIDADLQQDPVYAVEMAKILDENPDCDVVAAYQKKRKEGLLVSGVKKLFYKLISKAAGIDFITDASDFRTMRRCVAETIIALPEYHRFSKGIFAWVGFNTIAMPYEVKERFSGKTKWSFVKLLKYALDGIVAYTDLPLKIPFATGILMILLSIIQLAIFLYIDFFTESGVNFSYVTPIVLFVGGIICMFLGILGYYLGKIHSEVKHRPIYISKEILSYENNKKTDN